MTPRDVVLAAHRARENSATLVIDDDVASLLDGEPGVARLSSTGLDPSELWSCSGVGGLHLVVVSSKWSARDLFRVLALVERFLSPDGRILILPPTDVSVEIRPEATEVFCGAYPWARRQVDADVVDLTRTPESHLAAFRRPNAIVEKSTTTVDSVAPSREVDVGKGVLTRVESTSVELEGETRAPTFKIALGGKRVVSLAIFGDSRRGSEFWRQMPTFAVNYLLAHHAVFSGYELWIHHDENLFRANGGDVLFGLARRGLVKLVYAGETPLKCVGMLWRLLPAWDPTVDVLVCRDVDSLPTWRDRQCVEEFVSSGLGCGVIHDNPEHGWVMGGLVHFRADLLRGLAPSLDDFISSAKKSDEAWSIHGADQDYLNERSGSFGQIFEHSLKSRGIQTIKGSLFAREIALPGDAAVASVSPAVREGSDLLTNYMGSAGYDTRLARAFYDNYSPIADAVREAEHFARGQGLRRGSGEYLSVDEVFLSGVDNWCNHRPLLYLALEETAGSSLPVLEMGMGDGSTSQLHAYCESRGRLLRSYDSAGDWIERFVHLRTDWHLIQGVGQEWESVHDGTRWSVALVDHAPGERRYIDVERLADNCDVIVIHDSEPEAVGYGLHHIWHLFKYRVDVKSSGAWATAVSNTVNVTKWRGRELGGWRIS